MTRDITFIDHLEAVGDAHLDVERVGTTTYVAHVRRAIRAGNHSLSIQASQYHYCSPRESLLALSSYTHFELCLYSGESGPSLHYEDIQKILPTNLAYYWEGDGIVAGYVPVADVQRIVDILCDLGRTETLASYAGEAQ